MTNPSIRGEGEGRRPRKGDLLVPYGPLSSGHGVKNATQVAIESDDLPSYKLGTRWRYVWESDFYAWLDSRRAIKEDDRKAEMGGEL